jgi:hypothetical protein
VYQQNNHPLNISLQFTYVTPTSQSFVSAALATFSTANTASLLHGLRLEQVLGHVYEQNNHPLNISLQFTYVTPTSQSFVSAALATFSTANTASLQHGLRLE